MASHGAMKEMAATEAPKPKAAKVGKFHHLELTAGANGGAMAQHFHEHPDGYGGFKAHGEPHIFADGDGSKLAAHIEKHLGIAMPGKSMAREDEPEEKEENIGKE